MKRFACGGGRNLFAVPGSVARICMKSWTSPPSKIKSSCWKWKPKTKPQRIEKPHTDRCGVLLNLCYLRNYGIYTHNESTGIVAADNASRTANADGMGFPIIAVCTGTCMPASIASIGVDIIIT